jgi:curved DNA-binding protein CbpA
MNPYKIMNVKRNATQDEIKRSYRKLIFGIHPETISRRL